MKKLRYIHAADLHLGSYIHCSGMFAEYADVIKKATYSAFEQICTRAIEYAVDFILLAGDVFDQEARSVEANRFLVEQCLRLQSQGISVYIIAGNHDPLREKELFRLPENVYVFGSDQCECIEFTRGGEVLARIVGQSYKNKAESRRMFAEFIVPDKHIWNIGLLHTQLEGQKNNYVPCSITELREVEKIHYWALGHIHQCRVLQSKEPMIAFSGVPQGRDFGEEGMGGCLLVEVDVERLDSEALVYFVPTSPIVLKRVEVKIDELRPEPKNLQDLEDQIAAQAERLVAQEIKCPSGLCGINNSKDFFQGYVIQWVITGRVEIHNLLREQLEEVEKDLTDSLRQRLKGFSPFVWTDSVAIRTAKPLPDLDMMVGNNQLFKELQEVCGRLTAGAEEDEVLFKELIASCGQMWEWQTDHESLNEERLQLNDQLLREILNQAENLIIEKVLEGRELL